MSLLLHFMDVVRFIFHYILVITSRGRKEKIPPVKDEILLLSATTLASHIRTGKLTSQKIVKSYIERIKEVQPFTNGLAEGRFDLALQEATQVDEFIASHSMTPEEMADEKPLLGVPFTVKSMIAVEGMGFTAACSAFAHKKADRDSDIVKRLKSKGAIVLGTSNIPELALNPLNYNSIYGNVKNAYDSRMNAGITSSGEAVLNALAATPFGVANDLYGSIRVPACFAGVFGHRSTVGLLPAQYTFPGTSEFLNRLLTYGPICRHSEDLVTFMKAVMKSEANEMRIGEPVDFSKITIYWTHSFPKRHLFSSKVDDDVLWTVQQVINYFKDKFGTCVKYIEIDELIHSPEIVLIEGNLGFDNSMTKTLRENGCHSSLENELKNALIGKSNFHILTLISYLACHDLGPDLKLFPRTRQMLQSMKKKLQDILQEDSVLLYPTCNKKFLYNEEFLIDFAVSNYNGMFTLLGVPVTQCPVDYSEEGLPLGIQVIGGKKRDNLTIAVAMEIEKGFGKFNKILM